MQIIPGLYQVGGSLNGLTWAGGYANYDDGNLYVLATGQGLVLFDCGNGDTLDQAFSNMAVWGLRPGDIRACFITHAHLDHAGGAYRLAEMGVRLFAHEETADAIASGDERCCGYLYHKTFHPCQVDTTLRDGEMTGICGIQIEALHLPGHTMGCTAYRFGWDGKTVVVSGDVIGTLLDGHFGWSGSIDFDKTVYLSSLKRFARLDSDLMLPGHGLVYYGKPRQRVEQALNEALVQWR